MEREPYRYSRWPWTRDGKRSNIQKGYTDRINLTCLLFGYCAMTIIHREDCRNEIDASHCIALAVIRSDSSHRSLTVVGQMPMFRRSYLDAAKFLLLANASWEVRNIASRMVI